MPWRPEPAPVETRDWTFVLQCGCEQCGYQPHDPMETPARIAAAADIESRASEAIEALTVLAPEDWGRPAHRSDGKPFTVATLCQFTVHDVEHHLNDVQG